MAQISLTSADLNALLKRYLPEVSADLSSGTLTVSKKDELSVSLKSIALDDHIQITASGIRFQISGLAVKSDSLELSAKISA